MWMMTLVGILLFPPLAALGEQTWADLTFWVGPPHPPTSEQLPPPVTWCVLRGGKFILA